MAVVLQLYSLSLISSLSGMEILSGILTLGWLVDCVRRKRWVLPLWKPIGCFCVVVALGIFLGNASSVEKWRDLSRLRFFLFFWASAHFLKTLSIRRWLIPLAVGCLVICLYGTLQHFFPIDWVRSEGHKVILFSDGKGAGPLVLGLFNHHLTFSNVFLLYAPLFLSYGFFRFPKNTLFWALGLWLALLVLWTYSRSAWVAVPVTVLVVAVGKSWHWRAPLIGLLCTLVVLLVFYATNADVRERFGHTFQMDHASQSLSPRLKLWRANWEMFKESPLIGVGWNNNERHAKAVVDKLFPEGDNFYGHAHSTPLQILVTTGLLGALAFGWVWAGVLAELGRHLGVSSLNREERWVALGIWSGLVGFWVQGVTQWNFGDAEVLHSILFLWGVTFALTGGKNAKGHQTT
ncbi:MAG: O-antigen ligase family protein [Deltaproteobacteria bacterium]|nr:O-antigen ligase family protein [Deltaproteobacteria bacterium]MBI3295697.1 O-antigen ligase family protein [Deltaproteobacteria bacterium]